MIITGLFIRTFMVFFISTDTILLQSDDETKWENVTDAGQGLTGRAIRAKPASTARGGLSDARLTERGGRCCSGSVVALSRTDAERIRNLAARLTTVVGRVCLDMLRSRNQRQEQSLDTHLPDPVLSREDQLDSEREALIADSAALALLVVLETLASPERLALVLHDMFAVPFSEIASILECSPTAARQFASGARRRVRGSGPFPDTDLRRQREVVDAFLAAVRARDFDALLAALDPDVIRRADHLPPETGEIHGARDVAESALLFWRLAQPLEPVLVNGAAGLICWLPDGRPFSVMAFIIRRGRIAEIDVFTDPERLVFDRDS